MKKMLALVLSTVVLVPVCAAAQRRTREAAPIYTHVPCNTPGARQERPIDLSTPPSVGTAKIEQSTKDRRPDDGRAARIGCVVEGPPPRR